MRLPLRVRLTLVFSAGMALVLVGLGAFAYLRVGADLLDAVDIGLRSRAQVLVRAVQIAQDEELISDTGRLIDPDEAFAQVLDPTGRIVDSSSAVADIALLSAAEIEAVHGPGFVSRRIEGLDDPVRLLSVIVDRPDGRLAVVVGATLGDTDEAMDRLLVALSVVGPLALLLTAGAGWLLAGAALRPVEQMRREAAALTASDPLRRLPVPTTGDELSRLATTLNAMLDRLQEAMSRERRFVDDASHELRTPLATLRAEIDLALARPRTPAELEAALLSARDDVDRLQRLTDDLLVLARSHGGRIPVRREPAALDELLDSAIASVRAQAIAGGVDVTSDAPADVIEVDPNRVRQAVANLLENAVRHTPRGGRVRVTAVRDGGLVRIAVQDSGSGFPPELLAAAFDPFERGADDPADREGTGLGLAIVQAVADAHGGAAFAENTPEGARVTLELHA
ncbi:MAG TPA: ATP-binding protein [Patescibacteria group bacterium]|nr:ATP-binding protein [Patescibacteria group bacterium]